MIVRGSCFTIAFSVALVHNGSPFPSSATKGRLRAMSNHLKGPRPVRGWRVCNEGVRGPEGIRDSVATGEIVLGSGSDMVSQCHQPYCRGWLRLLCTYIRLAYWLRIQ